jgi:hypothetical protein
VNRCALFARTPRLEERCSILQRSKVFEFPSEVSPAKVLAGSFRQSSSGNPRSKIPLVSSPGWAKLGPFER